MSIVLAAQIACAVVLCIFALFHERHTRMRAFDESIHGRSDSLLGAIQDAEDPADNVNIDPTELRLPHSDVYAVYYGERSLGGSSQSAPGGLLQKGSDGFREQTSEGKRYRVFQRDAMRIIDRAENGGVGLKRPVTIVYAAPEGHVQHEVLEAAGYYMLLILVVLAATGVSVLVLVSRALRPLADLAQAASALSPSSLAFTAPASVLALSELRPLAAALGRAVDDLRDAFDKEKRFIGDATHELKTAVAVVRSTVQVLMLKTRSVEEHSAGLSRVLVDVARVETLVGQMLSSAAADEASGDVPPSDLSLILLDTMETVEPIAKAHGVGLKQESCETPMVLLRPERASTLISNLLLNAVQHSSAGMMVWAKLSRTSEGRIVLTVTDTGNGIAPEALPHVFERFYREDHSRSRKTGGAGLGLSICKSIVEAAAGVIEIGSSPHSGTTVTVTFSGA